MNFDHFNIRLMTSQDADNYFHLVENNRERLADFFPGTVAKTQTITDTENFLAYFEKLTTERTFYPYAIVDLQTNQFIGYLHASNVDWNISKAEIGFYIDRNHSQKGIITKAVHCLMNHYFDTLGFNKIFLRTHPENTAAIALAEKCGFELEGRIRHDFKTSAGKLIDLLYYGKLRKA